eukprot:TRINITY_DN5348_c0_g1_i5.p1 TRINITY_DN5348_c0_g1~~TRINITY_DN5348_c0_g1_i5.p1  ORF type:complete len:237 (+),score=43.87 TRINITY_DN5348_c0_g1_i5:70-780(+)
MPILSLARVVRDYFHPPPHRCLMIGLDAGGKTSLLYKWKYLDSVTTIPTVGFNVETVDFSGASFTIWDVGVRDKGRPLWRHYFQGMDILIFVIDSNDQERMEEASRELSWVVESDDLQNAVILIFASKQDLPRALSVEQITEKCDLQRILKNHQWRIIGFNIQDIIPPMEALLWAKSVINDAYKKKKTLSALESTQKSVSTTLYRGFSGLWRSCFPENKGLSEDTEATTSNAQELI